MYPSSYIFNEKWSIVVWGTIATCIGTSFALVLHLVSAINDVFFLGLWDVFPSPLAIIDFRHLKPYIQAYISKFVAIQLVTHKGKYTKRK